MDNDLGDALAAGADDRVAGRDCRGDAAVAVVGDDNGARAIVPGDFKPRADDRDTGGGGVALLQTIECEFDCGAGDSIHERSSMMTGAGRAAVLAARGARRSVPRNAPWP